MIYQLCNQGYEQVSTFTSTAIIRKESLSYFNHLTSNDKIEEIITNIPDSANVIIMNLLPEDLNLDYKTKVDDSGKSYTARASMLLTPQDAALQQLLETYNNEEVVAMFNKNGATHIYGTPQTPLLFTYDEVHSNSGSGNKGYSLDINGRCLGKSKIFESITFNIYKRGLAFTLAGSL